MSGSASHSRRVLFIVFKQFELLDLSGPASVFSTLNSLIERDAYTIETLSSHGGLVRCFSGIEIATIAIDQYVPQATDILIVVGGLEDAMRSVCKDGKLVQAIQSIAPQVQRIGSVCTGTFLLGVAGLLNERRAATHWMAANHLSRAFPLTEVDDNALYVNDEHLWTSAGVSSGIDMALAMVEADFGTELKIKVAKMLVVYAHRPGYQSQFSQLLDAQAKAGKKFARVVDWIEMHLDKSIKVADLAKVAKMSERNFTRRFSIDVGTTPSRFVENLRLERARQLLESQKPIKAVTRQVGYRSETAFRSAFEKHYGITPSMYRTVHRAAPE